mmetsp:Transcript_23967/g.49810  ORF Transcript_23967/g.49810 Transcript_23967/m.49810 type:complete len:555 (-) Transcript_23967:408-2072(-)
MDASARGPQLCRIVLSDSEELPETNSKRVLRTVLYDEETKAALAVSEVSRKAVEATPEWMLKIAKRVQHHHDRKSWPGCVIINYGIGYETLVVIDNAAMPSDLSTVPSIMVDVVVSTEKHAHVRLDYFGYSLHQDSLQSIVEGTQAEQEGIPVKIYLHVTNVNCADTPSWSDVEDKRKSICRVSSSNQFFKTHNFRDFAKKMALTVTPKGSKISGRTIQTSPRVAKRTIPVDSSLPSTAQAKAKNTGSSKSKAQDKSSTKQTAADPKTPTKQNAEGRKTSEKSPKKAGTAVAKSGAKSTTAKPAGKVAPNEGTDAPGGTTTFTFDHPRDVVFLYKAYEGTLDDNFIQSRTKKGPKAMAIYYKQAKKIMSDMGVTLDELSEEEIARELEHRRVLKGDGEAAEDDVAEAVSEVTTEKKQVDKKKVDPKKNKLQDNSSSHSGSKASKAKGKTPEKTNNSAKKEKKKTGTMDKSNATSASKTKRTEKPNAPRGAKQDNRDGKKETPGKISKSSNTRTNGVGQEGPKRAKRKRSAASSPMGSPASKKSKARPKGAKKQT